MSAPTIALAEVDAWIGREVGVGVEHDRCARVAHFAECTEDFQFIHLDPEAAKAAGFDGAIAHGFWCCLCSQSLLYEASAQIENCRVSINYGFEKVRFLSPVPVGSQIRPVCIGERRTET